MKRTVWLWELFGFAFIALGGTLLHFLYEWLGEAVWIAPFSGVNESTWEHMKLFFWPAFLFAAAEYPFFRGYEGFICIKLRGILLGLALIPLLFYTYNGVIGKSPDAVNIAIFFISAATACVHEAKWLYRDAPCKRTRLAGAMLAVIALAFILFTFFPPAIELFRDPLTGRFGI